MALKAGDIYDGSRALLNDLSGAVFTDIVQRPFLVMAYEEIRQECQNYNIPITNKTSVAITIPQGQKDIGGPTGPALPNDMIEPMECWEIPAGTNNDYMLMRRLNFLPKTAILTAYLEVWSWQEQIIKFLGANGDIQVKLDYVSIGMPDIVDENSIIKLTNAVNFLKAKTAAFCAMFIGENETRAQVLNELSEQYKDVLLNIKIKSQQGIQTRRRPFMAAYKNRGGMYGR